MNRRISLPKYTLTTQKKGSSVFTKMSYPVHCGLYSVLETDHHVFHFNLNNEIIRAKAKGDVWRHPHEWLKRTVGNDWVFYSTGGYTGVFEATGEYYLPNFRYPSNSILGGHPFRLQEIQSLADNWHQILLELLDTVEFTLSAEIQCNCTHKELHDFLTIATANTPHNLEKKARKLFDIIGGRISVLPPLIYINIGLESADQETLDKIGKPISAHQVQQAFDRIQDINNRYNSIEITANFLMDDTLPINHYPKIIELIRDKQTFSKPKGTIYFSPLTFDKPSRARLFEFNRLKTLSKFPTYLYIIQRL